MIDDKTLNQFEKEAIEKACCDPTECHWVSTDKKRILTLISAYRESREEIKQLRCFIGKAEPGTVYLESNLYRDDRNKILGWEPQGEKE